MEGYRGRPNPENPDYKGIEVDSTRTTEGLKDKQRGKKEGSRGFEKEQGVVPVEKPLKK